MNSLARFFLSVLFTLSASTTYACNILWGCPDEVELDQFESYFTPGAGVPAFSNKNNYIIGVETTYRWRFSPLNWPLQSVWVRDAIQSEVFLQKVGKKERQSVITFDKGRVTEAYYIEETQQALVLWEAADYSDTNYYLIDNNGSKQAIAEPYDDSDFPSNGKNPWSNIATSVVPSPNGTYFAKARCGRQATSSQPEFDINDDIPADRGLCFISIIEAASGKAITDEQRFDLPALKTIYTDKFFYDYPSFAWLSENEVLVTDSTSISYLLDTFGVKTTMNDVIECAGPSTASGTVSRNGEKLKVINNTYTLFKKNDIRFTPFGCSRSQD